MRLLTVNKLTHFFPQQKMKYKKKHENINIPLELLLSSLVLELLNATDKAKDQKVNVKQEGQI